MFSCHLWGRILEIVDNAIEASPLESQGLLEAFENTKDEKQNCCK